MKHRIIFFIITIICSIYYITAQNIRIYHTYVDLGLPSGLKWATCNVGATKPEEYGKYYTWQAAREANLRSGERTPTLAEWEELAINCTWKWVSRNGINGYRVRSKINSNSIFLPAGGIYAKGKLHFKGLTGCYWSSSIRNKATGLFYSSNKKEPGFMEWSAGGVHINSCSPFYGLSIRFVLK